MHSLLAFTQLKWFTYVINRTFILRQKTWKWWLSSKMSTVTLEWSFQIFQTHLEHRNHFKIMKLKTIKNAVCLMRRRIWVGLILSLFAEGHQLGGWVVGIYLLFAFHSHCLPTMETWQRFITRGSLPGRLAKHRTVHIFSSSSLLCSFYRWWRWHPFHN